MNFSNVPANGAIRLWLKGEQLTKRIPVKSINTSPMEYVNNKLKTLPTKGCTVEVLAKAGNSFLSIGKFDYPTRPLSTKNESADDKTYTKNPVSPSSQQDRMTYLEYDGVLAKHYEKCYIEEADKCRLLRTELDNTIRELNSTKVELQLTNQRNELDNMLKDIERDMELKRKEMEYDLKELERERSAQSGLGGLMDTIEKNTFLQGIIEKVIDNFINKKSNGLNGIPQVDDPEIQQAIKATVDSLVQLANTDKEHFAYHTLVSDKTVSDKQMAQYIYNWMNTPQEPSATDKAPDKQNNSNADVL